MFQDAAIDAIHRFAGGVPRLINTICDNCLFESFMIKAKVVDAAIVHSVAGDLGLLQKPITTKDAEIENNGLDEIEDMLDRLEIK